MRWETVWKLEEFSIRQSKIKFGKFLVSLLTQDFDLVAEFLRFFLRKMSLLEVLILPKLIPRKIQLARKFLDFHTVIYWKHFGSWCNEVILYNHLFSFFDKLVD